MQQNKLKKEVKKYWNKASCGTEFIKEEKYTKKYFESIEEFRYKIEPEIFAFAQFTRFKDKKVLEVGVGAGTDFLQWVRAGAHAHGIDLTQEAINNNSKRLKFYNLKAQDLKVADAENLPYEDNAFDLVYSWGVIHHSPDTFKCLQEIVRVTKKSGKIKIMIYNKHSLFAYYRWFLAAFLKGKFFKSLDKVLFYDQESLGTKAYTFKQTQKMLKKLSVKILQHKATVTQHDLLYYKSNFFKFFAYLFACILGWNRVGWFMTIELEKL
ncbi:class I SAM-dependent methyltransferase [Candidatus Babeliales bacterium]|nr:class I SAM-dependent methyltransferase [Candidatus Babeliales bacterium]